MNLMREINFVILDAQIYFLLRLGVIVTTASLYNCLNCIQIFIFFYKTKKPYTIFFFAMQSTIS